MIDELGTVDRSIFGAGTSETQWQHWAGWRESTQPLDRLIGDRLVVVAPHPDDEVLAAGGLMWAAAQAGRPVVVVAVSRGEGSHPGSARWPQHLLIAQRRFERANALAQLGVSDAAAVELAVPDGQVTDHIATISTQLAEVIQTGDTVVTTWRWDGHPDHEATTAAVLAANADRRARLLQAPVWGWHWAQADQLPTDPLLFNLEPEGKLAKERAVAEFRSQLESDRSTGAGAVLPPAILQRFLRGVEVFFGD